MEWIIVDDGTDAIGDLVSNIPEVKYFSYKEKMTLGKKRNKMHEKASGSILIYMDDDDYYPPERVQHAVDMLQKHPQYKIAGSSEMHIYFKHIGKMYQMGPYRENHATAATFAFRRELLQETSYDETSSVAEEKTFLKNWTLPLLQLDTRKTILVFSHIHNSFDKKAMLEQGTNDFLKLSKYNVKDYIQDDSIYSFFMKDIDDLLSKYEPGDPKMKPDVMKQMTAMKEQRFIVQQFQKKIDIQEKMMQELTKDNILLREKVEYLEKKIKKIVNDRILEKRGL